MTLIVSMALVIAINFTPSVALSLSKAVNSTTVTITNNEAVDAQIFTITVPQTITDGSGHTVNIKAPYQFTTAPINASQSYTFNVSWLNQNFPSDEYLGTFSSSIMVNAVNASDASITSQQSIPISFINEFCEYGNTLLIPGTTKYVKASDVKDISSDTDFKWKPLDSVDIEIKVANHFGEDTDAVVVVDLYDTVDKQFIGVDGDGGSKEDTIAVDDGKTETVDINIQVPVEAVESSGRYILYVKAYEDGNEQGNCNEITKPIQITRESREIKLTDLVVPSIDCGSSDKVSVKVANLGTNDEKKVKVQMVNKLLGIDESVEISQLNQDDNPKAISFPIDVPLNATAGKKYTLSFNVYYKYTTSDGYTLEDTGILTKDVQFETGCFVPTIENAKLSVVNGPSSANAGDKITITLTIQNTGSSDMVFTPVIFGADSFATVKSFSSVSIPAGQSRDVSTTLDINSDASGDYTYTIGEANNKFKQSLDIPLTVQAKSGMFSGLSLNLGNNWLIWVIVLVNVVLIILIIFVAIRIARK